jgi:RNA polymerase sigma-70 factor (ECF subfamily)
LDALAQVSLWLTADKPEADALVCEVYAVAYSRWDVTIFEDNCRVSLFRILVQLFYDGRWSGRSGGVTTEPHGELPTAATIDRLKRLLERGELEGGMVRAAIVRLPQDIRLVTVLSFIEGFSYGEIAEIIGRDVDVVRARLRQGRSLIQWDLYKHALRTANRATGLPIAAQG